MPTLTRTHPTRSLIPALLLPSIALSCKSGDVQRELTPFVRADFALVDEIDAEISDGFTTLEGETDYDSFRIGFGFLESQEDRLVSRGELLIGSSSFGDLDAVEIVGGGRFFVGEQAGAIRPYVGFHAVTTISDSVAGVDLGTQLGLAALGGLEVPLNENFALDFGIDYQFPLIAAESDPPGVDTEFQGFAVRAGVVVDF